MRDGGVVDSNPRTVRAAFVPAGFDPHPRFRWIVVATEYGAEHLALKSLTGLLGCAFLPQTFEPAKTASAKRVRKHRARAIAARLRETRGLDRGWLLRMAREGKLTERASAELGAPPEIDPDVFPLFPGYLMAQADLGDDLWRSIYKQPGVADIVRIAGGVGVVPEAGMRAIWRKCDSGGVFRARPAATGVERGTKVRILPAPGSDSDDRFAGLEVICEKARPDRIAFLFRILGREAVTWVPLDRVEVLSYAPYNPGDRIMVLDGPFTSFPGIVRQVDTEAMTLRVAVEIFGRQSETDLQFAQVEAA